ncbi:alpha/beta-hydrolase [Peniophora sp. CONT]|nr:alpha/beta-hydrolase [Peniophora sp. CONT]
MPSSWHALYPALALIPPALLTIYYYTHFPAAPKTLEIYPSLKDASLSDEARKRVEEIYPEDIYEGGAWFDTPYGKTRYWLVGPEQGKKVVLIHGISTPSIIWKDTVSALSAEGYRVLVYDLYGRGYSDAPATTYTPALYATQLATLMQHIKWEKAIIAGVSMGGGVATAFHHWFPHLVDGKVILICSVGLVQPGDFSYKFKFTSSPLYQATWNSLPGRAYLRSIADSESHPDPVTELANIQYAYLKGYNPSIASSLRDGPVCGLSYAFKSLAASNKDVLIIWGTEDDSVPYKYAGIINTLIPRSKLVTVEGGGHDLTIERPEEVNRALIEFLEAK